VNRRRSSPSYDRLVGRGGNGTIVIVLRRSFDLATALPLSAVHSLSRSFLVKTDPLLESYLSSVAFVNPCELLIPVIRKSDRELSIENAPQRAWHQDWHQDCPKLGAWHQKRPPNSVPGTKIGRLQGSLRVPGTFCVVAGVGFELKLLMLVCGDFSACGAHLISFFV
jgi:hypothetical protein